MEAPRFRVLAVVSLCSFFAVHGGLETPCALATVVYYSDAVQADADLIVQYDFAGTTAADCRADKSGGVNHLIEKSVGSPSGTITYNVPGFDASSTAVTPYRQTADIGTGFFTSQTINMPSTVSFEAIFMTTANTESFVAGTRAAANNRNYFVCQTSSDAVLGAVTGDNYGNRTSIVSPLSLGDWYYAAVTLSYDSTANKSTINTWCANLSDGDTTLTHTSVDNMQNGSFLNNTYLGVGVLNNSGGAYRPWAGSIDEISLYTGIKSETFFTTNLALIQQATPTLTWNGTNGNWGSSNWTGSPPDYPDASTSAIIEAGTVTVEANHAAFDVTMTGGTLAVGAGNTLEVTGGLDAAAGAVTLAAGATLKAAGGVVTGLAAAHGATIEASGDFQASHLTLASGATFVKAGVGTLSLDQSAGANSMDGTNTVQVDAGDLHVQDTGSGIGGAALALHGGRFSVEGIAVYAAGLLAGSHSGDIWTSGDNPGNLGAALSVQGLYTNGGANDALRETHWTAARADGGLGPGNTTLIYTGQVNLAVLGDESGAVTFVEQNDDKTRMYLNGAQILSDDSWNNAVSATYTPSDGAGWYDFEIRVSNGGSGYGFNQQQLITSGDSHWNRATSDPLAIAGGFGVAAGTVTGENADDYIFPIDPGDGSVFRYVANIAAIDMTDTDVVVTANSTLNAITSNSADFGALTLQGGILTTTGAEGGITFTGTTIGSASVGFDTGVKTAPGAIDGGSLAATITKTGAADLILDQPGVSLAGTTFDVQEGRLVAMHASNPLGGVTLQLSGGEALLSSPSGSVAYDTATNVTSSSTLTAGQVEDGASGPVTVSIGSATNGLTIDANAMLTMRSTDGYTLDVAGPVNGGKVRVTEGNVNFGSGGTVANLLVAGGTVGTPALNVANKLQIGSLAVYASGTPLQVNGTDLLTGERTLTLSGGTVRMRQRSDTANQIQGSIFRGTGSTETPVNLDGGSYAYSATRVFTGDKADTILALTEDPARNAIIEAPLYGATNNSTGWTTMFPGYTTDNYFVTAFSGVFIPDATGSYRFRGSSDDRSLMYIDVAGDGVFDTSDRVGPWAWDTSGYKTLEAGVGYSFVIISQEFSGNESANWYVTAPGGSEMRIDPSSPDQDGWWTTSPITSAINEPDTHFVVAASSTLDLITSNVAVLGNLNLGGADLSIEGAVPGVSFFGIGGTGTIASGPNLLVRDTIAPGNSVGTLVVDGNTAVEAGSTFMFEINSATGTAGTSWDLLDVNGTLDITALSAAAPMTVKIVSLDGETPGEIADFACTVPYEWEFLTYDAIEGAFSEDLFALDTTAFENALGKGYFEIIQTASGLAVSYVPEPSTLLLALLGALLLLARRRR